MSGLRLYGVPGKMTRRLASLVVASQGLAVFFGALVARGLASATGSNTSSTFMLMGSLLGALCILDAGLLRQPWGITLGWILQIATLACAFVVPTMLFVGVLFGALWLTALAQGRAIDEHVSHVDAQWYAAQEASGPGSSAANPSEPGSTSPSPSGSSSAANPSEPGSSSPDPSP